MPAVAWTSKGLPPAERAAAMVAEAKLIEDQPENTYAADHDLALIRMFEQAPVTVLSPYAGRLLGNPTGIAATFVTEISPYNYLRAIILTAHAMLARARVRGRFLTTDGTGKQKKRAMAATQWLDGWASEAKLHELAGAALLDAMVSRFGVLQLYEEDGEVKVQRVLPHEITYDQTGAMYGSPRVIHRRRGIAKGTLIAKFPAKEDLIKSADTIAGPDGTKSDMVLVRESWALSSSRKAKDGWHVIALDNGTELVVEAWEKPWFPLVFFTWDKAMVGLAGTSIAAQLENLQAELNVMNSVRRQANKLMAVPRVWFKLGDRIEREPKLTNGIGSIVRSATKPEALLWNPLPPQFYADWDRTVEAMFQVVGIARNMSEGVKPQGTESGIAQREAAETQNLRVQIYAQRSWEAPCVEVFQRVVEMAADITEGGKSYKVPAQGERGSFEEIDFKGLVSDLKTYKVTCYPTGFLPLTPAARLDFIRAMLDSKLWDIDRARAAFADLDVESEQTLENAVYRMFVGVAEDCLFEGKPRRPNELHVANFDVAIKVATVYLAMADQDKKIPAKNVSLYRRYLNELTGEKQKMTPTPSAAATPGAVPPPGVPMPVAA